MRRRIWLCVIIAVLPLAGCTSSHSDPDPVPIPHFRLVAFDSCDQLLSELRTATRRSVGPYGLLGAAQPEGAAAAGRVSVDSVAPAPAAAYSGTNVHEAGADEPDIVKTDGRRIVTVDRDTLYVVDPVTRALTGRLNLGASGVSGLLLDGDHALVLATGYPLSYGRIADRSSYVPSSGEAQVILVDLAGAPQVVSRYRGAGRIVDARQTGSVARVVLSSTPTIKFPLTAADGDTDVLLRGNQRAVSQAPIDAWLPEWEVTTGSATTKGRVDCSAVSRPSSYSGGSMLRVLTFDLAATALTDGSPVAVVADGDTVYGTPESLYIANDQRWRIEALYERTAPDTEIYKFSLPPSGKPALEATGSVPGMLLNQYSMSEWDGRLRVATTDSASRSSAVRVLADQGGKLVPEGVVDGLGKGEQIYAVRFLGPRGYVVTFRQTDPLYSLDLSDPAKPRVSGELKIDGYSAHLQPVGDDLLVGVGQDASAQGVRQGLSVSLFDVADPAAPRRIAQHVVPQAGSEAEFDPHALLWWPATHLLVVPVAGNADGALALRVQDGALKVAGHLTTPGIRRSLVIGDRLWTLSDSGLAVADLSTLDAIGSVPLR